MEGDGICVCGHKKNEHEEGNGGKLICFHDDNPDDEGTPVCGCMEFKPAEAEAVGA